MTYGSVCSGIEAATVAWRTLGWRAAWFAEIEPFPSHVLNAHYGSNVISFSRKRKSSKRREGGIWNLGDFTTIKPHWLRRAGLASKIDVLVGGTPCQSFSYAGQRAGLDEPRGNLTLEFFALASRMRPRWVVWENVPGVLSIDGGRTFGSILGALAKLGYGFAYRVLDAQHFGVPQRRRRVFVIGHLGDWRRAAAVLFERHCLSGHPSPGREEGKTAPTITARPKGGGGLGTDFDLDGGLIAFGGGNTSGPIDVSTICKTSGQMDFESATFLGVARQAVAFGLELAAVRRLTPKECERLQGFPDEYTLVPYRNKPAADGPRYRAIGNSMAVPVMRWIGERIQAVDDHERD